MACASRKAKSSASVLENVSGARSDAFWGALTEASRHAKRPAQRRAREPARHSHKSPLRLPPRLGRATRDLLCGGRRHERAFASRCFQERRHSTSAPKIRSPTRSTVRRGRPERFPLSATGAHPGRGPLSPRGSIGAELRQSKGNVRRGAGGRDRAQGRRSMRRRSTAADQGRSSELRSRQEAVHKNLQRLQ
jgi:hypothetical protein